MINGFFTWPDLYKDMIKRFPSGSTFVEVGLLYGHSLMFLVEQMIVAGKTFNIYGIDHFEDISSGLLEAFNRNLSKYKGKYNVIVDKSVHAAERFDKVDFVFIDAAHDYDSVKADIEAWLPKTTGVIAGHDYVSTYPGVVQAVDEIFGKRVIRDYEYENCWYVNIK